MIIKDKTRKVEIKLHVWDDSSSSLSPDFSNDFFESRLLPYIEEENCYIVEDVDYCYDQAFDLLATDENMKLFFEELERYETNF